MTPILIAQYSFIFALVGALMLAAVPEKFPTVREFGKAMMYAGLFAFAFALAHKTITIP